MASVLDHPEGSTVLEDPTGDTRGNPEPGLESGGRDDAFTGSGSWLPAFARSILTVLCGAVLVFGAVLAWRALTSGTPTPERVASSELITADEFVAKTGTELVYVAETAGGGMIDIRYRVIDPQKALVFHDETLPVAIHQSGGAYLERPFHDHSHDVELHRSVVYHELIVNLGSALSRGDVVTLIVGPYRLENVQVQ